MRIERSYRRVGETADAADVCFLVENNWDDFSFKTMFEAVLFDAEGQRFDLGYVKILKAGMTGGRVELADAVSGSIGESYCSLGGDREYYEKLGELRRSVRTKYLHMLRDCVFDHSIFELFRHEEGMRKSLLRNVSVRDVRESFPRVLNGDAELTEYDFEYGFGQRDGQQLHFTVNPTAIPPTNIHILIGRNGVGKTRLLAGMADALTENKAASIGVEGSFRIDDGQVVADEFLNVVVVSYSAFDKFDPLPVGSERTELAIPYYYVGIKGRDADLAQREANPGSVFIKSAAQTTREFSESLGLIAGDPSRLSRWGDALKTLASDPILRELGPAPDEVDPADVESLVAFWVEQFAELSSGHKIVLLSITKLVEVVSDRSLILMDEPETHLHPPLLASYIRALSNLLKSRNAIAIIATHSPVVLQEVPSSCVHIISRSGQYLAAERPDTETFAENVGILTRRVFGLEVEESGFYRLLSDEVRGVDYDEAITRFNGQVGGEGRALIRSFLTQERDRAKHK